MQSAFRLLLIGLAVVVTALLTMSVLAQVGVALGGRGAGQVEFLLIALPVSAGVGLLLMRRFDGRTSVDH